MDTMSPTKAAGSGPQGMAKDCWVKSFHPQKAPKPSAAKGKVAKPWAVAQARGERCTWARNQRALRMGYHVQQATAAQARLQLAQMEQARAQRLLADFEDYLNGFSPNVQDILENFKFRNHLAPLSRADALGTLISKFLDPDMDLSPSGTDNHAMGTIFEELVRKFNEENNEEAGEHFTPRDVVTLMAKLLFLPVADKIQSSTYSLYDGCCGTGGMLTVAEEELLELAKGHDKEVSIHLFGQEINPETYAICKADLLLKGEGAEADNIVGGADKSTLSADQFPSRDFDFMLSNPPYGKSWKTDLARLGGKKEFNDPRFIVSHAGNNEFKLITRSSDGQLMFLVNKLQKMKQLNTC